MPSATGLVVSEGNSISLLFVELLVGECYEGIVLAL